MRVIDRTDLPMAIEGGGVEFRTDRAGEQSIAWVRLPEGSRPAARPGRPARGPVPLPALGLHDLRAPAHAHQGRRPRPTRRGQAFYWAPGHAPEALEDCEYVDVSPTAELDEVVRHLQSGGPA